MNPGTSVLDNKQVLAQVTDNDPSDERRFKLWKAANWRPMAGVYFPDGNPRIEQLNAVENEICSLQGTEWEVREGYGAGDKPDEEELLQWAKTDGSEECPGKWETLDELRKLRVKKLKLLKTLFPDRGYTNQLNKLPQATVGSCWWCVVIGISDYPAPLEKLPGASPDAFDFNTYLTNELAVPESNIRLLLNKEATREKILSTFSEHLLHNPSIQKSHKRLIYFAGHGTSYEASEYFTSSSAQAGTIDGVCPFDRGQTGSDGMIYDISDRELNNLLRAINLKWGSENVLIFDCCYAGSMTRKGDWDSEGSANPSPEFKMRVIPPLPNAVQGMLNAAKRNLMWDNQSALVENWRADMTTHVMLAACRGDELATEFNRRGVFTKALLSALRSIPLGSTTWEDLGNRIGPLHFQSPQVLGRKESRVWFV